jgi:hypothetical protein
MKKTKIIIPALAMLAMSTAATVTGTVAWFSMNKTVSAEGMILKAKGQGSIIVTKYDSSKTNNGLPKNTDKTTGIDFDESSESPHTFYPSTHIFMASGTDVVGEDTFSTYESGLKYVSNGDKISRETGTAVTEETTLSYAHANGENYFHDYDLYIAGDGSKFDDQVMEIKVSAKDFNTMLPINKAISVDFYGEASGSTGTKATVSASTYLGTLSVAGTKNTSTNTNTASRLAINPTDVDIPQAVAAATAGYSVKMRVYYDGGLIESAPNGNTTKKATTLKKCAAADKGSTYKNDANVLYYYNAAGAILHDKSEIGDDESVADYYIVDYTNSVKTYARTSEFGNVANVEISVTFTLSDPVNP